ncbi:glycosyltransferase family 1 protein [Corchorus capsularis]|uniref:Glycosyltransferase family 1 protein n=1 Tax=Corchorus capsularis TaxID=210143 RepID=A0A1R3JYQ0_COCAP|nr:glycosyltransferase family 1 protein [Corchorus capsularis]
MAEKVDLSRDGISGDVGHESQVDKRGSLLTSAVDISLRPAVGLMIEERDVSVVETHADSDGPTAVTESGTADHTIARIDDYNIQTIQAFRTGGDPTKSKDNTDPDVSTARSLSPHIFASATARSLSRSLFNILAVSLGESSFSDPSKSHLRPDAPPSSFFDTLPPLSSL